MKNFYILTNMEKDPAFDFTSKVENYIRSKGGICTHQLPQDGVMNMACASLVPSGCECVIVLGGDGTLIQAARDLATCKIPVFGVNIGTVGYLTDIDKEHCFSAIDLLMADEYSIDERMILEGEVYLGDGDNNANSASNGDGDSAAANTAAGSPIISYALNDIVIGRLGPLKVINFDVYVNGQFLINYPADGLVISTPTGSTAYNLSAGGPIISPCADIIVMTPICPHILTTSSVVFEGGDELEIRCTPSRSGQELRVATFDGSCEYHLKTGDRIVIRQSKRKAYFARTDKQNFLQILRNRLS